MYEKVPTLVKQFQFVSLRLQGPAALNGMGLRRTFIFKTNVKQRLVKFMMKSATKQIVRNQKKKHLVKVFKYSHIHMQHTYILYKLGSKPKTKKTENIHTFLK